MLTPARSNDFEVLKDSDEILPSNRKTFGVLGVEFALGVSPPAAAVVEAVVVFAPGFALGDLVAVPVLDDLAVGAGVADSVSVAEVAGEEAEVEAVAGSVGYCCCG